MDAAPLTLAFRSPARDASTLCSILPLAGNALRSVVKHRLKLANLFRLAIEDLLRQLLHVRPLQTVLRSMRNS